MFPASAGMNRDNRPALLEAMFPASAGMNRSGAGPDQYRKHVPRERGDEPQKGGSIMGRCNGMFPASAGMNRQSKLSC